MANLNHRRLAGEAADHLIIAIAQVCAFLSPKIIRALKAAGGRMCPDCLHGRHACKTLDVIEQVLKAQSDVLNIAERIATSGQILPIDKLTRLLPELAAPTEALHFNVTCRGAQKIAWVKIPLADIKAIKDARGCSVNDVALALVTSTIRLYAALHGDRIKRRLLRIMVPVNLRSNRNTGELGNRVSMIPVTIPLDIRNPRKLLAAVHERTEFLKSAHVAELVAGECAPGYQ